MRPYWAMLRARFLGELQYRVAALAGLGTQIFWGFVRIMVFAAFFRSTAETQPLTYGEVVTYVWLGQATLMLLIWRPDPEVEEMVRTGHVSYEFLRPVDLYGLWFARSLAGRAAPTLLRAVPMMALAMCFFGMQPPASWAALCAWTASILGALLLSAAIATLLTITLFWTISGRGIAILIGTGVWGLSGVTIPLPLLPDWIRPAVEALPFRGLMDLPSRLWIGEIPAHEVGPALALQLGWVLALVLVGRALLAKGRRRVVVQGG